jgi:hypothetical protein
MHMKVFVEAHTSECVLFEQHDNSRGVKGSTLLKLPTQNVMWRFRLSKARTC